MDDIWGSPLEGFQFSTPLEDADIYNLSLE